MFNQPWPADSDDVTGRDPTPSQGWAICRAMVEAHGGRISGHRTGIGVRVAFTLPAAGAGSGTGPARDQSTSRRTGRDRVRILALRGEPQTRDEMQSIFSGAGFSFLETGQVSNLERLVEMEQPDLLLLDMTLLTLSVIHMQVGRLGDGALGWPGFCRFGQNCAGRALQCHGRTRLAGQFRLVAARCFRRAITPRPLD